MFFLIFNLQCIFFYVLRSFDLIIKGELRGGEDCGKLEIKQKIYAKLRIERRCDPSYQLNEV